MTFKYLVTIKLPFQVSLSWQRKLCLRKLRIIFQVPQYIVRKVYYLNCATLSQHYQTHKNFRFWPFRTMADFLSLPEVCQEKIYRFLDVGSQGNFTEAFEGTPASHVLNRIKIFRQEVSCWICLSQVFIGEFWHVSQPYNGPRITRGPMKHEPKFMTSGFTLLYKYDSQESDRRLYIRRDRKKPNDVEEMDQIFAQFEKKLTKVFKAKSLEEMNSHFEIEHNTPDSLAPQFFEMYRKMEGLIY